MSPDVLRRADEVADSLALACLAAMVSLPFLFPHHYNPIPSFWSEWWAFAFGLAAAALLLLKPGAWRPVGLPAVAAIPCAFLAVALMQYFAGRWYFVGSWLMHAIYLLWAAIMMLAGRSLVSRHGLVRLAETLAAAILFGALCNAGAAALQFHGIGYQSGWVFVRRGISTYGNLGQANHLNDQLWLGIASLYYLHLRQRCRLTLALPALLILLMASTMSMSKSILLYAVALTVVAGLSQWKFSASTEAKKFWRLTLPLVPLVLLLQLLASTSGITGDASSQIAAERLFNQVAGYQIRWRLARTAWNVFLDAPLLGNGIGTLPWQFFVDNNRYPLCQGPAVAEHAHNLPLQLLAEFGIVPLAIMMWLLVRWAAALWRQSWQYEHCWLLSLLSVAAIHSLLEYPLWYSFFLGPVALLLGASEQPAVTLKNGWRGVAMFGFIIVAGAILMISLGLDYSRLEKSLNSTETRSDEAMHRQAETLMRIQRDPLLAPYVTMAIATTMEVNDRQLEQKISVCREAMKFAPSRSIVFKCGELTALAGDAKGALEQTELALRAYPAEATHFAVDLKALAPVYPRLNSLLPLAERYAKLAKQLP